MILNRISGYDWSLHLQWKRTLILKILSPQPYNCYNENLTCVFDMCLPINYQQFLKSNLNYPHLSVHLICKHLEFVILHEILFKLLMLKILKSNHLVLNLIVVFINCKFFRGNHQSNRIETFHVLNILCQI